MRLKSLPLIHRDTFFATVFTFLVSGILYLFFINISILDPFEAAFKDFRFTDLYYSREYYEKKYSPNIVIVNIGHANRFEISEGIQKVKSFGPAAIGLDVIFLDKKSRFMDSVLRAALSADGPLVFSYYRDQDTLVQNHPYFKTKITNAGYNNLDIKTEDSRVIREFRGARDFKDTVEYSFATRVAIEAGWIPVNYAKDLLNKPFPIRWIGNQDSFLSFNLDEIRAARNIPAIKDAVVLFGYLGSESRAQYDIEDKHFTPLNPKFIGRSVPDMYGVVVQANILHMLKEHAMIKQVYPFLTYFLAFLVTYFVIYISIRIYIKSDFGYEVSTRVLQIVVPIIIVFFGLMLMNINIYLSTLPLIILAVLGIELIDFYIYLMGFLNEKFGWKSSLLPY